jgi:hypothetical protein
LLLRRARAAAFALAATACTDAASRTCPVGDRRLPIELTAMTWDGSAETAAVELVDGGEVVLRRPAQGGKVLYLGVRARNVDACGVQLTSALRDPTSGEVIALDQRPVPLVAGGDGWAVPAPPFEQALTNLGVCPNADAEVDVDGHPWRLELRLEETSGARRATIELTVWPRCPVGEEAFECACECDSDFHVGGECPVDP